MIIRTITNVDKTSNNLEDITALVGPDWGPLTLAEAVEWSKKPNHLFVVAGAISALDVMAVRSKTRPGHEYLQTLGDNIKIDNLLTLPGITKLESLFGGRTL